MSNNITLMEKIENSMQTISYLRVNPFLPFIKINKKSQIYKEFVKNGNILERETSWGKIQIRNRLLTQYHFDILSGIFALENKRIFRIKDGGIMIFFSLYQLSKIMNISWGKRTKEHLKETIVEITDLNIAKWNNNGDLDTYKIIEKAKYSNKIDLFGIKLSKDYADFFSKQLTINYKETYIKMRKLVKGQGEGLIKAIINFFITHKQEEKIGLVKLLETIGHQTTQRQIRRAIEILNKNKEILEKEFNIEYDKKTKILKYKQIENIKFIPALPAPKKEKKEKEEK